MSCVFPVVMPEEHYSKDRSYRRGTSVFDRVREKYEPADSPIDRAKGTESNSEELGDFVIDEWATRGN